MNASFPNYNFRLIQAEDNSVVAKIIRSVMKEYGVTGEKTSFWDAEIDTMYDSYQDAQSTFFVLEKDKTVIGCGGIGPLADSDGKTCELRKMYFLPEARGKGLGKKMLNLCLEEAKKLGYQRCYLETSGSMQEAQHLYKKTGFKKLDAPQGNTGHGGCLDWYVKKLA